ncbi:MAG: 5'/3'-nucleotidase SurE [Bacillota bacterium]
MKVLLTNDDGIWSRGLAALAQAAVGLTNWEVYVVAPDRERSACGHSITIHEPIYVEEVEFKAAPVAGAWRVSGTPADCTKIGIELLVKEKPAVLISGVNRGPNLGTDILYSGTVSAAMEGCLYGIPSIAVSLADFRATEFGLAANIGVRLARLVLELDDGPNLFNVNVPAVDASEIKGVLVTSMGRTRYRDRFEGRKDSVGRDCFWLTGDMVEVENQDHADVKAVKRGYVSITPLHLDLTASSLMTKIQSWPLHQLLG